MSHNHSHEEENHIAHDCDGQGHQHHHHEDGSCCCHKHEVEFHGINKTMLARLAVSALLFVFGMVIKADAWVNTALFIASALVSGYDIILTAIKNIFTLRFFDEYFLMSFAAIAACIIGECEEGAAVFLLYRIGESCQSYAIRHSSRRLSATMHEHYAHSRKDGEAEEFITRFARIYTPIVLILAAMTVAVLTATGKDTLADAVYRALSFLVLACPCAIVISVPMAYSAGIVAAASKGIFFASSTAIDRLTSDAQADGAGVIISEKSENGPGRRALAVKCARHTKNVVLENIILVIGIKLAALIFAVLGKSELWISVLADSGITIIAVLNSLRALHIGKLPEKH